MLDDDVKTRSAANAFIGANTKETRIQKNLKNRVAFLFIAKILFKAINRFVIKNCSAVKYLYNSDAFAIINLQIYY